MSTCVVEVLQSLSPFVLQADFLCKKLANCNVHSYKPVNCVSQLYSTENFIPCAYLAT